MQFDIHISDGNDKIGHTHNLSMPPILSCRPGVPCAKICYALNSFVMYPQTVRAWTHNMMLWRSDPEKFTLQFNDYMDRRKKRKFFRWFVGGDIPDWKFLSFMCKSADRYMDTAFLVFTKRIDLLRNLNPDSIPGNLKVIISTWPGDRSYDPFLKHYAASWFVPHGEKPEDRIPGNAVACPGKCETCRYCWLARKGRNIMFHEHGKTWRTCK